MHPRYTKDSTNHSEDTEDAYYADQESRSDAEREGKAEEKTKVYPKCTQGLIKVFDGTSFFWADCERCNGTGKIIDNK